MKRFLLLAVLCLFSVPARATTVSFVMDASYTFQIWTLDVTGFVVPPTDPYETFQIGVTHTGGPTVTMSNDPAYIDNWTKLWISISGDGGSYVASFNGCSYNLSHCERGDRPDPGGLYFLAEPQTLTIELMEFIHGPLASYGPLELDISFPDNVILAAPVPEPSTWFLMLLGFAGIGTLRLRSRFLC